MITDLDKLSQALDSSIVDLPQQLADLVKSDKESIERNIQNSGAAVLVFKGRKYRVKRATQREQAI